MEQKLLLISHESYHLGRNFSLINSTGGNVCIYVRYDMIKNTLAKKNLNSLQTKSAANIFIEQFSITIVCICRASSADLDQFLNLCDVTLKYLHNLNMELVICGDFNISHLKDSLFKQHITLLFRSYNRF
jgi:exonuclease III